MLRPIYIPVYAALILLSPSLVIAGEGVDVSFSVQELRLQDSIRLHLSPKAQWALAATDVGNGKRLADAGSAVVPLIPGSLMKLFITAAILERNADKAVDLSTVIGVSGYVTKSGIQGDIVLRGAGNPFLSIEDLQQAVEKIKSLGVKEITGDVIVDDSLFDVKDWKTRYTGPAYGVPSALGIDLHTVSLTVEGPGRLVAIDPPNGAVKVSINPSGKPDVRRIDDLTYEVTGAVPDAPAIHKRFSLDDPAFYAGGTFKTLLDKQGIKVSGMVRRGPASSPQTSPRGGENKAEGRKQFREIARIGSRDISAYVRDANQHSLNVAADNLLFLLGALAYGAPGTREKGAQAVNDFLRAQGVPLDGLVIDDGSGVSERNRVSSEQMVTFLRAVAKKSWHSAFFESLSRPGIDGREREVGYRSDRVRIKSGQVSEAYCLAGYVDHQDGRKIAFSYMVNGSDSDILAASSAAVEVLRQLAE